MPLDTSVGTAPPSMKAYVEARPQATTGSSFNMVRPSGSGSVITETGALALLVSSGLDGGVADFVVTLSVSLVPMVLAPSGRDGAESTLAGRVSGRWRTVLCDSVPHALHLILSGHLL